MILAGHHSIVTDGTRHKEDDRKIYLSKNEMEQLVQIFADDCEVEDIKLDNAAQAERVKQHKQAEISEQDHFDTNMNSQFFQSLRMLGLIRKDELVFDAVLTAHDHNMSNFCTTHSKDPDEFKFCQFTSGAGSTRELQSRTRLTNQRHRGCFIKKPGFLEVAHFRPKQSFFTFRTADCENTLLFTNTSPRAVVYTSKYVDVVYPTPTVNDTSVAIQTKFESITKESENQKERIQKLFDATEAAIIEYFRAMDDKKLDADGIERAHKVWAFISDAEPKIINFDDVLNRILVLAKPKIDKLYQIIVEKISAGLPGVVKTHDETHKKTPSIMARTMSSILGTKPPTAKAIQALPARRSNSNKDITDIPSQRTKTPLSGSH